MDGVVSFERHHRHGALSKCKRGLHGLEDARLVLGAHHNAVHHSLDVVDFVSVHLEPGLELLERSVHAGAYIALTHDLFEQLTVMSFPSADHRRQQQELFTFKSRKDVLCNLRIGVPDHGLASLKGKGICGTCIQQPQKVMDFGDGAYGGTWVFGDRFLLNGHHRT